MAVYGSLAASRDDRFIPTAHLAGALVRGLGGVSAVRRTTAGGAAPAAPFWRRAGCVDGVPVVFPSVDAGGLRGGTGVGAFK